MRSDREAVDKSKVLLSVTLVEDARVS